jgi:arylsulfatase A-like enzyme
VYCPPSRATQSRWAISGRSLVPLLEGKAQNWPTEFFYEHYFRAHWRKTNKGNVPRSLGVRGDRWKYVHYFDEKPPYEQLFDLKKDPHGADNLASDPRHRKTLEAMRRRMEVLQAKAGPPWKPGR